MFPRKKGRKLDFDEVENDDCIEWTGNWYFEWQYSCQFQWS